MAIYSFSISNVSRINGSNTCATVAYITGKKVRYERENITYSYGRSDRVEFVKTILPKSAPREFENPEVLFNSIEKNDKSANARTGKKIIVALPREFDHEHQEKVLDDFIQKNITKLNYPCTYAIHTDSEGHNPHAHILIANRPLNSKGEWALKSKKEYALDEKGERIPLLDEKGNQKLGKRNERLWKRVSVKVNPLDLKNTLETLRKQWEIECNKYLDFDNQIDHRSFEEQGREEKPTIHEGFYARKIEENGGISSRCETNREIKKDNALLKAIKEKLDSFGEITGKIKEKGVDIRERVTKAIQRNRNVRNGELTRANNNGNRTEKQGDIKSFIADINAKVGNAEISREEREIEQRRLDNQRKREIEKAERERQERERASREKAKDWDFEL